MSSPDRKPIIGTTTTTRWKTVTEQQIYSMKLIKLLRRTDRTDPNFTVREKADRLLAFAAGGRTRWSRAILANRFNRRRRNKIRGVKKMIAEDFRGKTRVLGELVPGGRKLEFSRLIDEAADYIAALEMQVRAMSAVAGVLDGAGDDGCFPADLDKLGSNN